MERINHFEGWMVFFITLFFAISSIFLGISQTRNNEATDLVLESVISYENQRIFSDLDIKSLILLNSQQSAKLSEQVNTNYGCLISILAERMEPFDRELYDLAINTCKLNISKINYPAKTNYTSNPIQEYTDKIEEIYDLRGKAKTWQFWSTISFMFALASFVLILEKRFIEHLIHKKEIKTLKS